MKTRAIWNVQISENKSSGGRKKVGLQSEWSKVKIITPVHRTEAFEH